MTVALAAIQYPVFDPVLLRLGPVAVRWYGIAYLLSFVLTYFILHRMSRRGTLRITTAALNDLMTWLAVGVVVGGRAGWWMFYHRGGSAPEPWYEPFAIWHGGMSFHGGLLGVTAVLLLWSWSRRAPFWNIADAAALVAPIGLFLGRVANFINAELVGRATTVPWGVVFPGDTFTRHPSQLYEAVLEGPVLLACLWGMKRLAGPRDGRLASCFLVLYGLFRFGVEFTREPDPQLGFVAFGWMTMGQLLSAALVVTGVLTGIRPKGRVPRPSASTGTGMASVRVVTLVGLVSLLSGCVLAPGGAKNEQAALREAGQPYRKPFPQRDLPELPPAPEWPDILHRAFLANGDLEAAYFEWAAAVSRIQQAGAYPNTPVSVGFEYMFSGGNMKAWDRTTVTVAPDAMENLSFPTKTYQAAKVALDDAQAAGKRVLAAKFDLQRRVLHEYLDYALLAEKARVQRDNAALLKLVFDTAASRVQAGAPQQDVLRAEIAYRLAENDLKVIEAGLPQKRAMLNAMLAREPEAPLPLPLRLPRPRSVPEDDAALLAVAVDQNPELAGLARQVQGRRDALELARMQYIPDFNPMAGFTGGVEQFVGVMVSLPTVIPEIQGGIKEARAELRQMQAMYRQRRLDRAASFVAALYALRNSERQVMVFEKQVLPRAEQAVRIARESYATGGTSFTDVIDIQRTLLDVRLMIAEASASREKSLAELESLAGLDIETLTKGTSAPTTIPSSTESATMVPASGGTEVHLHEQ